MLVVMEGVGKWSSKYDDAADLEQSVGVVVRAGLLGVGLQADSPGEMVSRVILGY